MCRESSATGQAGRAWLTRREGASRAVRRTHSGDRSARGEGFGVRQPYCRFAGGTDIQQGAARRLFRHPLAPAGDRTPKELRSGRRCARFGVRRALRCTAQPALCRQVPAPGMSKVGPGAIMRMLVETKAVVPMYPAPHCQEGGSVRGRSTGVPPAGGRHTCKTYPCATPPPAVSCRRVDRYGFVSPGLHHNAAPLRMRDGGAMLVCLPFAGAPARVLRGRNRTVERP